MQSRRVDDSTLCTIYADGKGDSPGTGGDAETLIHSAIAWCSILLCLYLC